MIDRMKVDGERETWPCPSYEGSRLIDCLRLSV